LLILIRKGGLKAGNGVVNHHYIKETAKSNQILQTKVLHVAQNVHLGICFDVLPVILDEDVKAKLLVLITNGGRAPKKFLWKACYRAVGSAVARTVRFDRRVWIF